MNPTDRDNTSRKRWSWRFYDLPIQHKITLTIIVGMASAMLVTVANFIAFDRENVRRDLTEEMRVLARITAVRSAVAVAFGDRGNALENLSALSLRSTVQHACIYDAGNELFANFHRERSTFHSCPASLSADAVDETQIQGKLMVVVEPIQRKGKKLGHVLIASDLSPISARTRKWIYTSFLVTLGALAVAFLMTRRMQNAVVKPIVNLASLMDRVKQSNDLSLRADVDYQDEVGQLVDSFNNMLRILQLRNRDLELLYHELVEKSAEAEATAASLEVSNKMIKDLFNSAAHDLRQPLQAMAIFADALQRKLQGEDNLDLLMKLKQAMRNLNDLFTEVLDVSRYEFDLTIAATQPTDIKQLLSRVFLEFEAMAGEKQLRLRFYTPEYTVLAHGALLERIIRNLLSNAIRYTDKGGVLLGCRRRGNKLMIEVWDTGRGIPPEKQKDIFSQFVQVDDDQDNREGFGLGLAIVKQFVDTLGYELTVHSQVGRGTVFRLVVPLMGPPPAEDAASAAPPALTAPAPPGKSTRRLSPDALVNLSSHEARVETRILLIDDSDVSRNSIKLLLESWGFVVDGFADIGSMEDFYRLGGSAPRLIIADWQLGGDVTGEQAILAARAVISTGIAAFVATGSQSEEVRTAIAKAGLQVISKPVRPARLRAMVNHCLS